MDLSRLSGSTDTGPGTTRSTRGHPIRVPAWAWPAQTSGGYEIRTREGVNPTRFPSLCTGVRRRPAPCMTWARGLCRTSPDHPVRQRMRPELRPAVGSPASSATTFWTFRPVARTGLRRTRAEPRGAAQDRAPPSEIRCSHPGSDGETYPSNSVAPVGRPTRIM